MRWRVFWSTHIPSAYSVCAKLWCKGGEIPFRQKEDGGGRGTAEGRKEGEDDKRRGETKGGGGLCRVKGRRADRFHRRDSTTSVLKIDESRTIADAYAT